MLEEQNFRVLILTFDSTVMTWASYLASLSLNFLICKMRVVSISLEGFRRLEEPMHMKCGGSFNLQIIRDITTYCFINTILGWQRWEA
jgi:hypothetical protein